MIRQQFNKAMLIPRSTLLHSNTVAKPTRSQNLICRIPVHPKAYEIKKGILSAWNAAKSDVAVTGTWPNPPAFLPMRGKNLGDLLVRTKQHLPPGALA